MGVELAAERRLTSVRPAQDHPPRPLAEPPLHRAARGRLPQQPLPGRGTVHADPVDPVAVPVPHHRHVAGTAEPEAAVDHASLESHPLAKRAKDMASAAVLIALVAVPIVWLLVLLG